MKFKNVKRNNVLVLVATYNEAENIGALLKSVLGLKGNFDVLVVDDNSPDGTGDIVKRIYKNDKRVKLIIRKGPKGRGLASIRAYEYFYNSEYGYMCELDADFQEDPEDIFKLIRTAEKNNCDIVLGSRYVKGGSFSSNKKWLSLFTHFCMLVLFRTKIKDPTNWFHLLKKDVFDTIPYRSLKSRGFFLASELHFLAERAGLNIKEIPIFFPKRKKGETKVNYGVAADFAKEAIQFLFRRR
jgi:dolichol-phosphate mannosyltransferase